MDLYNNAAESLKLSETKVNTLEEEKNTLSDTNLKLRRDNIAFEKSLSNCIRKDERDKINERNERLETKLAETRAAMLTYKNMCTVIGDQVKNLKLMQDIFSRIMEHCFF